MTFKVLTDDTRKVIYRSEVRSAMDEKSHNLRLDPIKLEQDEEEQDEEDQKGPLVFVKTRSDMGLKSPTPVVDMEDRIGRTFLMTPTKDGEVHRDRVVEAIHDYEASLKANEDRGKMLLSIDEDRYEDVMAYNEVMDHVARQYHTESPKVWKYCKIISHSGSLRQDDPSYNDSRSNVMVQLETGKIKTESLTVSSATDSVMCDIYARENSLLDTEEWKLFKRIARRRK
jgi:hypothetical protein